MKISKVSCTQFAGIRNQEFTFTDGINLVYGKNESGKSTLANLIGYILFQNNKLDGRTDKDFIENFFPVCKKGSNLEFDFADGQLTIETEDGTYVLKKEWERHKLSKAGNVSLSTPDGVIKDADRINEVLKSILLYGKGIYSDFLLTPQRNLDTSLKSLLNASEKNDAKDELIQVVSQAFAESDGISMDAVEQEIQNRIRAIAGKDWDIERQQPKSAKRNTTRGSEILKAYYCFRDANDVLNEVQDRKKQLIEVQENFIKFKKEASDAEQEENEFRRVKVLLENKKIFDETYSNLQRYLERCQNIEEEWPALEEKLKKAQELNQEKKNRELVDKYRKGKKIYDEIVSKKVNIDKMLCPTSEEIQKVERCTNKICELRNWLRGMNLTAAIHMMGENQIFISSISSGEKIEWRENLEIHEAVNLVIPGVMEMVLAPIDVNLTEINREIENMQKTIDDIFTKYQVDTYEQLENLSKQYGEINRDIENLENSLNYYLGEDTLETLQVQYEEIDNEPREKQLILQKIEELGLEKEISDFIACTDTILKGYQEEFENIEGLREIIRNNQINMENADEKKSDFKDIPPKYVSIELPEKYMEELEKQTRLLEHERDKWWEEKISKESRLEEYLDNLDGDPIEQLNYAQQNFEYLKELLKHWNNIEKVFKAQKEKLKQSPMQDIAEHFSKYLQMISDGQVISEFPNMEKLDMEIYSKDRLLNYAKLSEGTKETVSLAFRLAVLDHLFPEGGGIAIFDDPFANMDTERTAQSVALIQDFAKRHQVIFLTCKDEYLDLFPESNVQIL